ncbi:MAG TPA: Ig-like domain-containing protein, partial [Burkholderiales bacterium]|nr:Ig-like domain-containing protein [Burkholderiales bacterium]
DRVRAGSGNDVLVYNVSENAGASDAYDGGSGSDTLRLEFTRAEWERADVQADVARFIRFLDRNGDGFQFRAFNLEVENIEQLQIVVDGSVVTPGDNPVDARDDAAAVVEEGAAIIHALANDSAPDGVAAVDLVGTPAHGTLTLNPDRTFTYVPGAFFDSLADGETATESFTYRVIDTDGDSDLATVVLTITGTNDAPVAEADSYSTNEDTPLAVTAGGLLANDSDVDGDALSALLIAGPAHGSLILNADGTFSYTPDANFNGADSFTYRAADGSLSSAAATVHLTIAAVNDDPTAAPDAYAVNEDVTLDVDAAHGVLSNDSDIDGDTGLDLGFAAPISFESTLGATVFLRPDGSFTYSPQLAPAIRLLAADETIEDSFSYTLLDGNGGTAAGTVLVTVTGVADTHLVEGTPGDDPFIIGTPSNDLIRGLAGNDLLAGLDGDDRLEGGPGVDTLIGGPGADTFLLDAAGGDAVFDFVKADGDKLDIREVLQGASGYDGTNAFSGGFLAFETDLAGTSTLVQFDADGAGGAGGSITLATLTGVLLTPADTANYIV